MKEVYIIFYNGESMYEITTDPVYIIRNLMEHGYSYDDMLLYKAKELDFTVDFNDMEVKIKE